MEFNVAEVESIHGRDIIALPLTCVRVAGPGKFIFSKTLCGSLASQIGGEKPYMSKTEKMFSVFVLAAASVTLSIAVAGCNSQPAQDNTAQNQTAAQPATGDQAQNPEADANLAVADAPADNTAASSTVANNAPPPSSPATRRAGASWQFSAAAKLFL